MKAVILGGTSGIGREINKKLKGICRTYATGRKEVDTSSLRSVNNFITKNKGPDILVLNTGGPPDLDFEKISDDDWMKYFNQLFLSFSKIIKDINVKKNGYIFLISSFIIKQPGTELLLSSSLRSGFTTLFKSLSKIYKKKKYFLHKYCTWPHKNKKIIKFN